MYLDTGFEDCAIELGFTRDVLSWEGTRGRYFTE